MSAALLRIGSANNRIHMAGTAAAWRDWQRRADYYGEGVLLWPDVDMLLRERGERRDPRGRSAVSPAPGTSP
jgi:predicted metalloprotease with PDZ domain